MAISLASIGVPTGLTNIIQQNTLQRQFQDALFPLIMFRAEAVPETWVTNLGERTIFTRTGLMPVNIVPLAPGTDPQPSGYGTEQWAAEARQFGGSIPTHMPSDYVALASLFLTNTKTLGLNAGQTMNRLARNRLYSSYLEGEAMARAAVGVGVLQIQVSTISGFTERILNGTIVPVSAAAPIPVTFTGTEPANFVVAATPSDPTKPLGNGTITLATATTIGVAIREGIKTSFRSLRLRVGAGATVDALTSASIITLQDVIGAVTRLRDQNVPTHPDGRYHVHLTPQAEQELFADNAWQRLHQSLPDSLAYRDYVVNDQVGCYFYRNTETPSVNTISATQADPGGAGGALCAPEIGGEVTNASGVNIRRVIVTGGAALYEKYIDESKYITEAGVLGKIGNFSIVNGGLAVMTDRIRFILKAPQDDLQQVVKQVWSWSGDFPVPSDALSGDAARYKRAVVIEHA